MASANPTFTEIVTTTIRNRSRQLADNVSNSNALTQRLSRRGNIRTFSGGRTIVEELEYAENSTFKYYSGYEQLDISPSDVLSAAEFDIKQAAVVVTMSGLEQLQNASRERMIDLMQARIRNAERTMANKLSEGVYSDGTGSNGKQITGLQAIVADDPTTGTVGGINRANFSFWRNQTFDATTTGGAAASASNIKGYMQQLWIDCIRGNDKPDLIVADANYFQFFWESLTDIQRINRSDQATSGFDSLAFNTADVVYDGDSGIPTNHMYFLNTDYLFWRPHSARNMVPLEARMSVNQDAEVVPLVFAGNLTCSNASLQGVLKD